MVYTEIEGIGCNIDKNNLKDFRSARTSFIFILSHSETSKIPGLTVAGENIEMVKYTPAADAEYIHFGKCKCINSIPATPDGKPTPAIITKTALELSNIPITVIDSGSAVKPNLPYVDIHSKFGKNILEEKALQYADVVQNFEMGKIVGKQLSKLNDVVILGESIPAGTTTALGVLQAMGINAFDKMSSSMPNNPHALKNKIIEKALKRSNLKFGDCINDPLNAISHVGDPFMPTIAGIASELIGQDKKIILAGGTQMCCIVAILKSLNVPLKNNICIGTTTYLINDSLADPMGLIDQIFELPIFYVDLNLQFSKIPGLKAYSEGFVKEGAGAGGSAISALLNNKKLNPDYLLNKVEENYEKTIKPELLTKTQV